MDASFRRFRRTCVGTRVCTHVVRSFVVVFVVVVGVDVSWIRLGQFWIDRDDTSLLPTHERSRLVASLRVPGHTVHRRVRSKLRETSFPVEDPFVYGSTTVSFRVQRRVIWNVDGTTRGWQRTTCNASCREEMATRRPCERTNQAAPRRPSATAARRRVEREHVRLCTHEAVQEDDEIQVRGRNQSREAEDEENRRRSRRPGTRGRKSNQSRSNPPHDDETTAVIGRILFDTFQEIVAMPSTSVSQPVHVAVALDGLCTSDRSSKPTVSSPNEHQPTHVPTRFLPPRIPKRLLPRPAPCCDTLYRLVSHARRCSLHRKRLCCTVLRRWCFRTDLVDEMSRGIRPPTHQPETLHVANLSTTKTNGRMER